MILIIDNYDSFTFNLYQTIASLLMDETNSPFNSNAEIRVIKNDEHTVAEILQMNPQAIILSPGPGRPEQAGVIVELVRHAPAHLPILGVCLGHQAIVAAFGGCIVSAPTIVHGKTDNIFHYRKNLYSNLPLPFTAGRYHSLIADKNTLPASLVIEAENAAGLIMGVRHYRRPVFGVQFHPESILSPCGSQLVKNFLIDHVVMNASPFALSSSCGGHLEGQSQSLTAER